MRLDLVDMTKVAYDYRYLEGTMNLTRLVFVMFNEPNELNELNDLNIYDEIDAYFQTSDIRRRMDEGNWSALMKGWKQVYNSVDFSNCRHDGEKVDDILLHWMADVTVYLQWKYNISSKDFNDAVDARTLAGLFNPLHEASLDNAAGKLYQRYMTQRRNL